MLPPPPPSRLLTLSLTAGRCALFDAAQDLDKGARIAEYELDAGMCAVNDFCKSNSRYPFGGHKDSGIGRECGEHGFKEFCNVKTLMGPKP